MLHRIIYLLMGVVIVFGVAVTAPRATSGPAASPEDRAREDLSRYEYPSMVGIPWKAHFVMPQDSLERLFGEEWIAVARFNRIDRRHTYPGMTIKVPRNMEDIRNYTPLPLYLDRVKKHGKYILLSVTEQWIGAYEYGRLVFSMPAATGKEGHLTPTGRYRVDAYHRWHKSSLYRTAKGDLQYPMDYALRFLIDKDNYSYWIHARDLPGRPASHGCVGLFDEAMQTRIYSVPAKPVIEDAKRLYAWVIGEEAYQLDDGTLQILANGPILEIVGELPRYLAKSPQEGRADRLQ